MNGFQAISVGLRLLCSFKFFNLTCCFLAILYSRLGSYLAITLKIMLSRSFREFLSQCAQHNRSTYLICPKLTASGLAEITMCANQYGTVLHFVMLGPERLFWPDHQTFNLCMRGSRAMYVVLTRSAQEGSRYIIMITEEELRTCFTNHAFSDHRYHMQQ